MEVRLIIKKVANMIRCVELGRITWYELLVQYIPAPPAITAQPQPSALTLQVGSSVTMSVGASGAGLSYQWRKDGQPVTGNPSATSSTLNLTSVQHADAGTYAALIKKWTLPPASSAF